MQAYHNSRDAAYRTPYGAALCDSAVTISIDLFEDSGATATVRTWSEEEGEKLWPLTCAGEVMPPQALQEQAAQEGRFLEGAGLRFTGSVSLERTGLTWYSFIIEASDGRIWHYGAKEGFVGGEGALYDWQPPSFQITVYKERAVYPLWFERSLVYQIFPDRFNRGADYTEKIQALDAPHKGLTRRFEQNWDTPPTYTKDENGRVSAWDFYGGTLQGIIEKLPYLKELGFSAIYLNPIFEAQSNHRYDTADYTKIDSLLGSEADFENLCTRARELGISIILDGVFNHTGVDSVYFNKYGNYGEGGAFQDEISPYRAWYNFREDGSYESWWGVDDLPSMNKNNTDWQRYVYGVDGIVERWLKRGARGWRLDVADELNDAFIAGIKEAETRVKPDALLLGEVWEDASHKVAYSEMRHYLCGSELDSVMNYPFRDGVLGYLTGIDTAYALAENLEALRENYPRHAFYEALNLLGSHDRPRVLSVLGEASTITGEATPEAQTHQGHPGSLDEAHLGLAKGRLWLAAVLQMLCAGVPCVYYGDEAGLQGLADPYNRATYPYGAEDRDCKNIYQNAIDTRLSFDQFIDYNMRAFAYNDDVFGIWRAPASASAEKPIASQSESPHAVACTEDLFCLLVNRSLEHVWDVEVEVPAAYKNILKNHGAELYDLIGGQTIEVIDDKLKIKLGQLGSALLYMRVRPALTCPFKPGLGVIAHITSLPAHISGGSLGAPAFDFVDGLASAGATYWQVLPFNPCDAFGSPYASVSAFAGNPDFIDTRGKSLQEVYCSWRESGELPVGRGYKSVSATQFKAFIEEQRDWLAPYATFVAIKEHLKKKGVEGDDLLWRNWPKQYKAFSPKLTQSFSLKRQIEIINFEQFIFAQQAQALKEYAESKGIQIIGDMPFYVNDDSADTWANPQLFMLNETGAALEVAGVPPLAGDTGQKWGNPTYRWDEHAKTQYAWWKARFSRMFDLYHRLRLDHFVGYVRYWAIPADGEIQDGMWKHAKGVEALQATYEELGTLPVFAEDLGDITPAIRAAMAKLGIEGIDVMQYHDAHSKQDFVPQAHKLLYTSTHDTQTVAGWLGEGSGDSSRVEEVLAVAVSSSAPVVMMSLQDLLALDDTARMNTPGTTENNWKWKANSHQIRCALTTVARLVL